MIGARQRTRILPDPNKCGVCSGKVCRLGKKEKCRRMPALGLARVPDSADLSVTLVSNDRLLGTPDFMAPEQILDSHKVDPRRDVYALGCTMYYLLAGTAPFSGRTMMEQLLKHQLSEAIPLYLLRRDVSRALSEVCARMMAKRPEDRYPTMNEVREALAAWAGSPTVETGECHGK